MFRRNPTRRSQQGYILLTLMLFVTLLAIAAAAIAPTLAFQVKRDREEEMIHRGVQYSRAVRHYYKKFGRYPTRLEELENTNNLRFLRKRYKDPITGQDFKVLHVGEVQLSFGAGIAGATPAGGLNPAAAQGLSAIATAQRQFAAANKPPDENAGEGDDSSKKPDSSSGDNLSGITFGGGPIVGVVSTSKAETIREFNKKKHYNQWQFIYDPSSDRGGLLSTPNQPPLQGAGGGIGAGAAGAQGGIPGQPGQPVQPPAQPAQQPDQQ